MASGTTGKILCANRDQNVYFFKGLLHSGAILSRRSEVTDKDTDLARIN